MVSRVPRLLPPASRALLARYGIAILGVILATLIRMWLHPLLREQFPFPTFFVVVILTARYVGLGPAILALLLGGASGTHFFVPPPQSPDAAGRSYVLGPGLYLLVGLVSAVLSESLRRARDTAEHAEWTMKEQSQQLRDANAEM